MASVAFEGQLYARIVAQKMRIRESQNEGGHSTAKTSLSSTDLKNVTTVHSPLACYIPFMQFLTVSACSSEKLPVDLESDLK